mgnify:FL=1
MTQHELHPLCTLFPRLAGAEFDALVADIKANGLTQPITTHNGMILDGGNRYRACIEAGVEPTFRKFAGANVVTFVLSANLHRRRVSAGQQAAIVASAQDWAQAQPASRPRKECNVAPLSTSASRAAESGASLRTQKMADKVAKADPALAIEVGHGTVSLPKAVAQVEGKSKVAAAPKPAVKTKANEPTIESLQAENEQLREALIEARDNARELAAMVESYDAVTQGEHAAAKEMTKLRAQLRTVEATRDQWMTTAGELRKEVKALQRKHGVRQ